MAETALTIRQAASTPYDEFPIPTGTWEDLDTSNGNSFANDETVVLVFKGATSATGQITFDSEVCPRGVDHDPETTANLLDSATKHLVIGPFKKSEFGETVLISYSGTLTNVQVSAIRSPSLNI